MAKKNDFASIRSFLRQEVQGAFFDEVGDRRKVLEQRIKEETKGLFQDVVKQMGHDSTPEIIGYYSGEYEPISEPWRRRKFRRKGSKKGKRDPRQPPAGFNKFHVGVGHGPRLRTILARRGAHQVFGEPKVTFLNPTDNAGNFRAENGGRVLRDLRTGRFASPSGVVFKATLMVDVFPKFTKKDRLLLGMTGKARKKLAAIEFGGKNRPARPLLAPMLEYYTDHKIQSLIDRTIR